MSNASNQPGWPQRFAVRAAADRCGCMSELGDGLAGASAGCHEFAATALDRVRDQIFLARKNRFTWHVLKSLYGHYTIG